MAMNRANFADELAPGFRQIFVDALKFGEKPSVINSIFNMPWKRNFPLQNYLQVYISFA